MKQVTISLEELVQSALAERIPGVIDAVRAVESATLALARHLATAHGVEVGACRFVEDGGGEFLVNFHQSTPGQRIPEFLRATCPRSEWATIAVGSVASPPRRVRDEVFFHRSVYEVEVLSEGPPDPATPAELAALLDDPSVATDMRLVGTEEISGPAAAAILHEIGVTHAPFAIDAFGQSPGSNGA